MEAKVVAVLLIAGWCCSAHGQQQVVDPDFKPVVLNRAYLRDGPIVAVDAAHNNFHTADRQYKPFADLLTADGYRVTSSTEKFSAAALKGINVLVIANANARSLTDSAFTDEECDAVHTWVQNGGALLLIADHAPFGASAGQLARRFGVAMGKGWVFVTGANGITTQLEFSRENGLLGEHPILRGRNASEQVKVVKTFTGQSLGVPRGASVLLRLSDVAREADNTTDLDAEAAAKGKAQPTRSTSVAGRAQGLAGSVGKGRLVILGEAALFSAQVVHLPGPDGERVFKAGMNAPGNDDQQFALNVLHWLSGVLQ